MQLPRGTFRGLKRGLDLHSLIREMEKACLSGYCKIMTGETSIMLVLSNGRIILAEYGTLTARAAMEELSRAGGEPVDAVLHDLSDSQLKLALEFNPSARVDRGVEPAGVHPAVPAPGHDIPLHHRVSAAADSRGASSRGKETRGFPGHGVPSPPSDDEASLLMRDLDALDSLDIQTMTEKFRANCRQMIEKLELEHLLEKNTRRGEP
jgi:hypothetical protein